MLYPSLFLLFTCVQQVFISGHLLEYTSIQISRNYLLINKLT
jgi:hypothetical protein